MTLPQGASNLGGRDRWFCPAQPLPQGARAGEKPVPLVPAAPAPARWVSGTSRLVLSSAASPHLSSSSCEPVPTAAAAGSHIALHLYWQGGGGLLSPTPVLQDTSTPGAGLLVATLLEDVPPEFFPSPWSPSPPFPGVWLGHLKSQVGVGRVEWQGALGQEGLGTPSFPVALAGC